MEKIRADQGTSDSILSGVLSEPLHSSFIMGRMARAAAEGGASRHPGNTREDIEENQKERWMLP